MQKRRIGIMVPAFSLPGDYGIGDIDSLYRLVDLVAPQGVSIIQLLPMNAVASGDTSPYSSISSLALNPLYISLGRLQDLTAKPEKIKDSYAVDYDFANRVKFDAFQQAYQNFAEAPPVRRKAFQSFRKKQGAWLESYALFHALSHEHKKAWWDWPKEHQNPEEAKEFAQKESAKVTYFAWLQWVFHQQWQDLLQYSREKGVVFMGDLPLYVSRNSADFWSRPEIFKKGVHAGVPPDMYAEEGQDWGNPIYDWDLMEKEGFSWWKARMIWLKEFFDCVRVDHVRGLYSFWEVPDGQKPKDVKDWTPGPKEKIIHALQETGIELVGEDLGDIPDEVDSWMNKVKLTGYRVFLFGWGSYASEKYRFIDQYPKASLATTSTHDSESFVEFLQNLTEEKIYELGTYLGIKAGEDFTIEDLRIATIKKILQAPSKLVILPLQDITGRGIRVNLPGSVGAHNWSAQIPLEDSDLSALKEFGLWVRQSGAV